PAGQAAATELTVVFLAEPRPPQLLDQELDPVALFVLVVAEPLKDAQHRFGNPEQLGGRKELMKQAASFHENRRATADRHPESASAGRAGDRAKPEIVDRRVDMVDRTAFERDLELSRQRRSERVPQQVTGQR